MVWKLGSMGGNGKRDDTITVYDMTGEVKDGGGGGCMEEAFQECVE